MVHPPTSSFGPHPFSTEMFSVISTYLQLPHFMQLFFLHVSHRCFNLLGHRENLFRLAIIIVVWPVICFLCLEDFLSLPILLALRGWRKSLSEARFLLTVADEENPENITVSLIKHAQQACSTTKTLSSGAIPAAIY